MTAAPSRPARSLWPREHGAYAQLGAPLAAALIAWRPTPAAVLLAVGACLAFLAHEPLLVALGHRGRRMRELRGRRARRLGAAATLGALGFGGVGLVLAPPAAMIFAAAVMLPTLALLLLVRRRAERTVRGEVVAATALSGAAAPVAIAAGASAGSAGLAWAAWAIGLSATVIAVHRVLARHRHPASAIDRWTAVGLAAVTAASVALVAAAPLAAIAAPLALVATVVVLRPPRATRLRAVGFGLLGASLLSGGLQLALAGA